MRKPRVILIDDEPYVLDSLKLFFLKRAYEVLTFSDPTDCPIYEGDKDGCIKEAQCSDMLVTDFIMPRMNGIELLQQQSQRGCKLDIRNKAIISGRNTEEGQEAIKKLGCKFIQKPYRISEFTGWVEECEKRFDLSEPLENYE